MLWCSYLSRHHIDWPFRIYFYTLQLRSCIRDFRSVDSGNEADVDTDWASTLPPHETALGSALSTSGNPYRHLSRVLSERLVQSALLAGAKDNISAIVVVLPGTKIVEVLEE